MVGPRNYKEPYKRETQSSLIERQIILAFRMLRQEDHEFELSLDFSKKKNDEI